MSPGYAVPPARAETMAFASVRERRLHANAWWPRQKQLLWNSMYNSTPGARYGQWSLRWWFTSRHTRHDRYVADNWEAFLMAADYRPVWWHQTLVSLLCRWHWGQEASRMGDSILSFFIRKRLHIDPFGTLPGMRVMLKGAPNGLMYILDTYIVHLV